IKRGAREVCVCIYIRNPCLYHHRVFITEEVHMFFKSGSLPHILSGSSPEIGTVWHIVTFTYTLEEDPEIKTPVISVDVKAETVSRACISDHRPVSGIPQNAASAINHAITVDVQVHH